MTCSFRRVMMWLSVVWLAIASWAQPQMARLKAWTMLDGMSNSTVTAIYQDRHGYMWIGTSNGLNCFNGYVFRVLKANPHLKNTIANNNIKCLYEDREGNLWIGQNDGWVSRFDDMQSRITNYSCLPTAQNRNGDVSGIAEDTQGRLWVSVDRRGIVCMDPKTGKILQNETAKKGGLTHNATTDIVCDGDGCLWISTWGGGLNKYDPRTHRYTHILDQADADERETCVHHMCLFIDMKGILWVGSTHSGAYRINTKTHAVVHYSETQTDNKGLRDRCVYGIMDDVEGNVWISTGNGISIFHPDSETFSYIRTGGELKELVTEDTRQLYRDHDGNMWIGSTKGLYLYHTEEAKFPTVMPYGHDEQKSFVQTILKDKQGRIWMQTENNLWRIGNKEQPERLTNLLPEKGVRAMYEDREGNIWFGFYGPVITKYSPVDNSYKNTTIQSTTADVQPYRTVRCFSEDHDGSLWIGTEVGLLNYQPRTGRFRPLIHSRELIFPDEKINAVHRDRSGDLWVGTEGGLLRYDKQLKLVKAYTTDVTDSTTINDNYITSICEDSHGRLWIGTMGGLCRFNHERNIFTTITRHNEPLGDPIMAIEEDHHGNLWLSSTVGIIQFNPENNSFHLFDDNDGLQRGEFNHGVASRGSDGEMVFGGINGANRFYPDSIRLNQEAPVVIIEEFRIFNKPVLPDDDILDMEKDILHSQQLELDYNQSTLSFDFAVPNYVAPRKIQYAYQMVGVDNNWVYTAADNRSATYANLRPGRYVFRVKASNTDGVWGNPTELVIVIHPPVWRTWWAYILYILLAGVLVYAVIRHLIRREQTRNQRELERLQSKQQQEMNELKFQLFTNISHEFRTSLTLILGPLEYVMKTLQMQPETEKLMNIIRGNAVRLTRLVNQLLDFRKVEARRLTANNTTQDIVPFLRNVFDIFQFYAGQQEFTYEFHTTFESLTFDFDQDKVDKVVYNLLSNAFKYTRPKGKVTLALDHVVEGGRAYVSISVADNGVGIAESEQKDIFNLFYQASDNGQKYRGGSGLGLNMTKELVTLMGGSISVKSQPGEGSVFTVLLPTEQLPEQLKKKSASSLHPEYEETESSSCTTERSSVSETAGEVILIVEDNADMRDYIDTVLGADYKVMRAINGVEGLAAAIEYMPDIIITDIMMPEMDGLQLFAHLKNDDRVSHIPVIMLTAVNEEQQIVEGFQMGVDDYITKPFSANILRARVANILAKRKAMWERMRQQEPTTEIETQSAAQESAYEKKYVNPFVAELQKLVNDHLADTNLGIDMLASHFNMSAPQLTRKTKALMDTTPYSFIIKIRMEAAVRLMKTTELNMTEIAYKCGYGEISNFSRSFTKFYGESPTQYLKKIRQ